MTDRATQPVDAWITAYYTGRDEDVVALAHPDVQIRPRAGQGERLYEGIDGVRAWLAATRERSPIDTFATGALPDGRVLAEASLDGLDVVGIFEVRDERIARVTMYVSDREMLVQLGVIDDVPAQMRTHLVGLDQPTAS